MRTDHLTTLAAGCVIAASLVLGGCQTASEKGVMDGNAPPMQHMQGLGQQMMQKANTGQPGAPAPTGQPAPAAPR